MKRTSLSFILAVSLISGCTHTIEVVKPKTELARIRRIYVKDFQGVGGVDVARECLRAVTGSGLQLAKTVEEADAILTGDVRDFKTGRRSMIVLGNTTVPVEYGQTATISNPVISLGGPSPTPQSPGFSASNPHIVMETAAVGIVARLLDVSSGNVLWSYEYTYESLDLAGALQTVVGSMGQSLKQAAPRLQRQKPISKKAK